MQSETGFYVARGIIGLLEGAFSPLTVMCLSNFYTNTELGFRVAILSSGINVSLITSTPEKVISCGKLDCKSAVFLTGCWFAYHARSGRQTR